MVLPDNPRELVRGLMRGNRAELKLGYSGVNATLAACRHFDISVGEGELELLAYAFGYGLALNELPLLVDYRCEDHAASVGEGYSDGRGEELARCYPTPILIGRAAITDAERFSWVTIGDDGAGTEYGEQHNRSPECGDQ